jgi:predicted nuclease of predicted toxin-antitoxin system
VNFFLDHDVPRDVGHALRRKGQAAEFLEEVLPRTTDDPTALRYAASRGMIIITCNRQDFLRLAATEPHAGIVILIRRRTRMAECAALLRLLEKAGETGLRNNINFA